MEKDLWFVIAMKVIDLFSGIGWFTLGLSRVGCLETVAFCEIDKTAQEVLKKNYPGVKIYDDITNSDFGHFESVGLVTAGFPCQDLSVAGQGAGLTGSRSGLFWHILRTVRMVGQPRLVLENVANLLNRGASQVFGALAQIGYDAQWDCIQACDVGLPHRRDRIFITANPHGMRELQPGWGIKDQRERAIYGIQESLRSLPLSSRRGSDNGLSTRVDGLGNAIVPNIAEAIGREILKGESK